MDINVYICFRTDEAPKLIDYFEKNQIPYVSGEMVCSVDILQSSIYWPAIYDFINEYQLLVFRETLFTKAELAAAEWLKVRSKWRAGYPQPEGNFEYECITYNSRHCDLCGCGLEQIDSFRIKKLPKWGKRNFFELNWIGDELFVSDRAQQVLEQKNITGISFKEVKNKNGTEVIPNVRQMFIHNLLCAGMIEDGSYIKDTYICPKCLTKKFLPSGIGMMQFHREIFKNAPDVVKTAEIFGSGHYAARDIVIRNHVYRALTENSLDASLVFEPIKLV